jgi:shikimate kinase
METGTTGYVVHDGCDHIFFVGFLGAGKSTLARNLGKLFRRSYVDTDRMVERALGKTVCDIFSQDGEDEFRRGEARVLARLKERKSLLVSCGGSIVT